MPFEGEFAAYKPLARIMNNPRVQEVVTRCRKRETTSAVSGPPLQQAPFGPSNQLPDLVLAVDGSYQQVPVDNGFPGAELAYLTAAAVLINLAKQRELDARRPVNPKDFRDTQGTTSIDCALPGCNVILDEPTPRASFRRQFFEASATARSFDDGESLLDTYEVLLAGRPTRIGVQEQQQCPYDNCPNNAPYIARAGCSKCQCGEERPVFSTDALRMYLGFNEVGSSGAMFAEAMQVWERLWVINFLRGLEAQNLLGTHRAIAIVLDGPLAVFGHPAWLSQAIYRELCRLNRIARAAGQDMLIIGVEKTGAFVEHFQMLDKPRNRTGESPVSPQTALLLSNEYIRRNIVVSESAKNYGEITYFGRKFFYKTKAGSRIVASLPFYGEEDRDLSDVAAARFPRLADAMSLLDAVFCVRYPNAIAPLVAAHAEAAIPLNVGRRVLQQLAAHLTGDGAR